MNENGAQSSANSMTYESGCYYSGCGEVPTWGIASSVETKNPDGSPLTLFACDQHYRDLTTQMREVGTRYSLFPVGGPHLVWHNKPKEEPDPVDLDDGFMDWLTTQGPLKRVVIAGAVVLVGIAITPFFIGHYIISSLFGWVLTKNNNG